MPQKQLDLVSNAVKTAPERNKYNDELSRVYSPGRLAEIEAILFNPDSCHYERLWMVGFLFFVGYDREEICNIIHGLNEWDNYDARVTYNQVVSIEKSRKVK